LEKVNHKNHINKCCGGLLAPYTQKMIAILGLGIPKDVLFNPQLFAVRTIELTNNLEKLYQRFYFNMDKEKFDRWLVSILSSGVERKFNAHFKNFIEISEGYQIKYIYNVQEMSAKIRIIVGADGSNSGIRNITVKIKKYS